MENHIYYIKGTLIGKKEYDNDSELLRPEDLAADFDDILDKVSSDECELAEYTDYSFVKSMIPSVTLNNGKLYSLTKVITDVELDDKQKEEILSELSGQFSDGWGEGFEQHSYAQGTDTIETEEWDEDEQEYYTDTHDVNTHFYVSFWHSDNEGSPFILKFVDDPEEDIEPGIEPAKPKCKLISEDGNVFNLIGLAAKCLKKNNMGDKAKEMSDKVMRSGSYGEALSIIGDYVEIC